MYKVPNRKYDFSASNPLGANPDEHVWFVWVDERIIQVKDSSGRNATTLQVAKIILPGDNCADPTSVYLRNAFDIRHDYFYFSKPLKDAYMRWRIESTLLT